jgi:hypothetical protein
MINSTVYKNGVDVKELEAAKAAEEKAKQEAEAKARAEAEAKAKAEKDAAEKARLAAEAEANAKAVAEAKAKKEADLMEAFKTAGLTEDEQKNHIEISKDLFVNKLLLDKNKKYVFQGDVLDGELIRSFLNEYISTMSKDTKNLECKMLILMEIVNHHLLDVCNNNNCKNIFSYDEINKVQKKYLNIINK